MWLVWFIGPALVTSSLPEMELVSSDQEKEKTNKEGIKTNYFVCLTQFYAPFTLNLLHTKQQKLSFMVSQKKNTFVQYCIMLTGNFLWVRV